MKKPKTRPVEDEAVWAGREKGKPRPAATHRAARRNKLKTRRQFQLLASAVDGTSK